MKRKGLGWCTLVVTLTSLNGDVFRSEHPTSCKTMHDEIKRNQMETLKKHETHDRDAAEEEEEEGGPTWLGWHTLAVWVFGFTMASRSVQLNPWKSVLDPIFSGCVTLHRIVWTVSTALFQPSQSYSSIYNNDPPWMMLVIFRNNLGSSVLPVSDEIYSLCSPGQTII